MGGLVFDGTVSRDPAAGAAVVLADRLAGDGANVLAGDAEIGKLAIGHAAQFGDGLAVLDPVVVSACNVHVHFLSSGFGPGDLCP